MKKKFLKVFSIVMCFISVFSDCNLYALKKYTIELFNSKNNIGTLKIEDIEDIEANDPIFCIKKDDVIKEYKFARRSIPSLKEDFNELYKLIMPEWGKSKTILFELDENLKENLMKKYESSQTTFINYYQKHTKNKYSKNFFDKDIIDGLKDCLKKYIKNSKKIKEARDRQEERKKGTRKCRYLSQRITASIPEPYKLSTPFGESELEFRHSSGGYYDVFIIDKSVPSTSYKYICNIIDVFVKNKKEFAKIIQDYLKIEYTSEYDGKDLSNVFKCMKESNNLNEIQKKANEFFEHKNNFFELKIITEKLNKEIDITELNNLCESIGNIKKNLKKSQIENKREVINSLKTVANSAYNWKKNSKLLQEIKDEFQNIKDNKEIEKDKINKRLDEIQDEMTGIVDLKKAASALSAILFISEPGPNRAFDGGKSDRASLEPIINEGKTFKDVFCSKSNDDIPFFSPAVEGGASAARIFFQQGTTLREKKTGQGKTKIEGVQLDSKSLEKFEENFYELKKYMSDDSDIEEEIEIKKEPEETHTELQNKFNEWIKTAKPDQIEDFEEFLKKQSVKTEN